MTAIAMWDVKAETITDNLWRNWFCYFGIPKFLQSDQGSNVDREKVRKLCAELAIKKVRSSSYHPQGNGSAESNRVPKDNSQIYVPLQIPLG